MNKYYVIGEPGVLWRDQEIREVIMNNCKESEGNDGYAIENAADVR